MADSERLKSIVADLPRLQSLLGELPRLQRETATQKWFEPNGGLRFLAESYALSLHPIKKTTGKDAAWEVEKRFRCRAASIRLFQKKVAKECQNLPSDLACRGFEILSAANGLDSAAQILEAIAEEIRGRVQAPNGNRHGTSGRNLSLEWLFLKVGTMVEKRSHVQAIALVIEKWANPNGGTSGERAFERVKPTMVASGNKKK